MLILALALGMIYQRFATSRDAAAYPPSGKLYGVGEGRLHMDCRGVGVPTVVMDSAIGAWSIFWRDVQVELSSAYRACAYDRAGYGWSEPSRLPRTGDRIVRELHLLLRRAGIDEPVLLIAHSFAGLTARIYAHEYPDEVLGLVLVDALHEEFVPTFEGVLSYNVDSLYPLLIFASRFGILRAFARGQPADSGLKGSLEDIYRAQVSVPTYYETILSEKSHLADTADLAREAGELGDKPLVIISARRLYTSREILPHGLDLAGLNARWFELQLALRGLSPRSVHLISQRAPNNVLLNDPKLVTAGVALAASMIKRDKLKAVDGE